jgi:hypothetical protein
MNKLDAVNHILRRTGGRPVSALDTDGNSTQAEVERFIDDEEIRVQVEGFQYNLRENVELTPGGDDKIGVPASVLWIDASEATDDVVQVGGNLYDRTNNTFTFDDGVLKVEYALRIGFECIPLPIRQYIVARAARRFNTAHGHASRDASLAEEELIARVQARRYNNNVGDFNMLETQHARELKGYRFTFR